VTAPSTQAVQLLLSESLAAWRVAGAVWREADGTLILAAAGKQLRIRRACGLPPFRWMVDGGERSRGVMSIAGLLRAVRAAVDADFRPIRLRISPLPLVPS
jgi:hypothetical protein